MTLFRRREPEFDWEDNRPFTGTSLIGHPDSRDRKFCASCGDTFDGAECPNCTQPADPRTAPLERLRARSPQPDTFPALKDDPRDTGPMQRMPRIRRVQERPRPVRPADAFIPAWSKLLQQFIMLCGVCPAERRNRYADPTTAHMPFTFEALRVSAYQAGWRLDAFAQWACPACQQTPAYHAPYPLVHYDTAAAQAYLAGDTRGERKYRDGAEHDLILDVHRAARRYRHAPTAGTR